jgi:hypothetical protein
LAALIVGIFFAFKAILNISPNIYDENAIKGAPDIAVDENAYTWIDHPEAGKVALCLKAVADESRKRVGVYLTAPEDARGSIKIEAFDVEFYVDEKGELGYNTGKKIGETGFVKAGEYVVFMDLTKKLDPKEFNGDQYPVIIKVGVRDEETGISVSTFFLQGAFYLE